MDPDEQEWRSRAHDTVGVKVIRLKSGRWALFDMWSQFICLLPRNMVSMEEELEHVLATHDFNAGRAKLLAKEASVVEKKPVSLAALDL